MNSTPPGSRESTSSLPSLAEVHRTIRVPIGAGFWRKLLVFSGPGFVVAVGYMDPGNWATDIAGGSRFAYRLISILMLSNLMALLLQTLAVRLGIVTQRDLAPACRAHYSRRPTIWLWIFFEIAISACDLAEVIGSAIALNLLFGLPMVVGILLTALDVLVILLLANKGFRVLECLVASLIVLIGGCFAYELAVSHPSMP